MITFLKKSNNNQDKFNIFVQNNQPTGYDGIWIRSNSFEYSSVVEVERRVDVIPGAINLIKGTDRKTALLASGTNKYTYTFAEIVLTDNVGNTIYNVPIYYGNGNSWNEITTVQYIELEYIESTGTQYIDTRISGNVAYMFELEYLPTSIAVSEYGAWVSSYPDNFTIGNFEALNKIFFRHRTAEIFRDYSIKTSEKNIISLINNTLNINGNTSVLSTANSLGTDNNYIYIYKPNSNEAYGIGRLYSFKLYDVNKNLLRDFIPVKDSNNVVCLFDRVSQQFFYNAGTGNFVAGKEFVNKPAVELEYIQSSGTQYINTGIVCATDMEAFIEVEFPEDPLTETCLAGSGGGTGGTRMFFGYLKNGYFSYGYKSTEQTGLLSAVANTRYRIATSLTRYIQHYIINGDELYTGFDASSYTNGRNLYIFACNTPKSPYINYFASMKLYGFKLWKNNLLLKDYVPAKDSNGVVCLYDKIEKTYTYNAGSGDFIAGGVVQ